MRAAILAALLADVPLQGVVNGRIYPRLGPWGGLPDAEAARQGGPPSVFTAEGELVGPSLVLVAETRTRHPDDSGQGNTVRAVQTFALFGYAPSPYPDAAVPDAYASIRQALGLAARVLHRRRFVPLEEDEVGWLDTRWASRGPELVEEPRKLPVIVDRYDATVTVAL